MTDKHPNDNYGDVTDKTDVTDAIPAATVVLLRDGGDGMEVLMLRKNPDISFGGMWVFPGGRIDPEDYPSDGDLATAAKTAAARETLEEAGLTVSADAFVQLSHWTPPPIVEKRFATWFFIAKIEPDMAGEDAIQIDDGEIHAHTWVSPAQALAMHGRREIDLVPPTWLTLYHINQRPSVDELLAYVAAQTPKVYETRAGQRTDGVRVVMWQGDAGYADWDADAPGARHRLVMDKQGFVFENDVETY